jgi:hypothetical protein
MARRTPAKTPEQRENQLIAAAVDLAEKQLEDGTASAQVISHFLKLGSSREKLEQEMIGLRNKHLQAQTEALAAQGQLSELIESALNAFRSYVTTTPTEFSEIPYDEPSQLQ